jgi:hypothetical protein
LWAASVRIHSRTLAIVPNLAILVMNNLNMAFEDLVM